MIGINSICRLIAMADENGVHLKEEGFILTNNKEEIKLKTPTSIEQMISTIRKLSTKEPESENKDVQDCF